MHCKGKAEVRTMKNKVVANYFFCCTCVSIWSIFTPHVQHEWGKVIGVGVHVLYMFVGPPPKKNFELYFSNRFTFSNICGRNSHQIYTLALPLRAPEMLSSSSKSRISYMMRTMLYLSEG